MWTRNVVEGPRGELWGRCWLTVEPSPSEELEASRTLGETITWCCRSVTLCGDASEIQQNRWVVQHFHLWVLKRYVSTHVPSSFVSSSRGVETAQVLTDG